MRLSFAMAGRRISCARPTPIRSMTRPGPNICTCAPTRRASWPSDGCTPTGAGAGSTRCAIRSRTASLPPTRSAKHRRMIHEGGGKIAHFGKDEAGHGYKILFSFGLLLNASRTNCEGKPSTSAMPSSARLPISAECLICCHWRNVGAFSSDIAKAS